MDAVKNTLFPGAGGSDSTAADGVPWWMKYVAKALAILSAVGKHYITVHYRITVQYIRLHYSTLQYSALQYSTVQYSTLLVTRTGP